MAVICWLAWSMLTHFTWQLNYDVHDKTVCLLQWQKSWSQWSMFLFPFCSYTVELHVMMQPLLFTQLNIDCWWAYTGWAKNAQLNFRGWTYAAVQEKLSAVALCCELQPTENKNAQNIQFELQWGHPSDWWLSYSLANPCHTNHFTSIMYHCWMSLTSVA